MSLPVRPLGDAAAVVTFADGFDPDAVRRIRGFDRELFRRPFAGLVEAVPTLRSLVVHYDPRRLRYAELAERLGEIEATPEADEPGRLHEIPTRYGGEEGPDLQAVAAERGLTPDEVARRHAARTYSVLMMGFSPGFAYLGPLDETLNVPRLATPRVRVAPGSVAVAGRMSAVYPHSSAGGWRLIGRTDVALFDPGVYPPAVLAPGDRVRFVPVDRLGTPPAAVPPPAHETGLEACFEVVEPGFTSVQDLGRPGWRRYGVPVGGAMDAGALRRANQAVGNTPSAAGLECTLSGPTLRFLTACQLCVTGADLGAILDRADLGAWPVPLERRFLARPGHTLRFVAPRQGCRAYVAVEGGVAVPLILGSRSTAVGAGFGGLEGRLLRAGDVLRRGRPSRARAEGDGAPRLIPRDGVTTLRVVHGPELGDLDAASAARLFDTDFPVTATSDRAGQRLGGPPLQALRTFEILSDGTPEGTVQVPPDGHPIVFGPDGATVGGYMRAVSVIAADQDQLGQTVPGRSSLRFVPVSVEEAQDAARERP